MSRRIWPGPLRRCAKNMAGGLAKPFAAIMTRRMVTGMKVNVAVMPGEKGDLDGTATLLRQAMPGTRKRADSTVYLGQRPEQSRRALLRAGRLQPLRPVSGSRHRVGRTHRTGRSHPDGDVPHQPWIDLAVTSAAPSRLSRNIRKAETEATRRGRRFDPDGHPLQPRRVVRAKRRLQTGFSRNSARDRVFRP